MSKHLRTKIYDIFRTKGIFFLFSIVFAGLALRLFFFNGLYGHDDWTYVFNAKTLYHHWDNSLFDNMWSMRHGIIMPVLLIFRLFGISYYNVFIPSICFSLGSIIVTFLITKQLTDNAALSLLASFIMAIFPLDVFVSTTLRGDVELNFYLGLSFFFYLRWHQMGSRKKLLWNVLQLSICALLLYLAYMTKDYAILALGAYALLFLYNCVRNKRMELLYAIIPLTFGVLFAFEGLVYKITYDDFFHRYNMPNEQYTIWMNQGAYENNPSNKPGYSFCVLANIPSSKCLQGFRSQNFVNSYYSQTARFGLAGYFYIFTLFAVIMIFLRRDSKYFPVVIFLVFLLAYLTFGTMNLHSYQNMYKETRYFNITSVFMAVIAARGFFHIFGLLAKFSYKLALFVPAIVLSFLLFTGLYALAANHEQYHVRTAHLPEVLQFIQEHSPANFFTSPVYGISADLANQFNFSDPLHWEGKVFYGQPGFGQNKDINFMTIDDLLSSPHYIIVYVPQDLFKLSNMFPDPTILDQLLISTIGQEQDEVRIYHISPDDLAIPSHTTKVQDEEAIYLESITPASYKQDYGSFRFGTGTGENPITIAGTSYDHGLTTHANGTYLYHLQGKHSSFYSVIGVDSANGCDQSSVIFEVLVDQIQVYKSPVLTVSSLPLEITIDVTGKNFLQLVVNDAGDGITCDHASWGNAILYTSKT